MISDFWKQFFGRLTVLHPSGLDSQNVDSIVVFFLGIQVNPCFLWNSWDPFHTHMECSHGTSFNHTMPPLSEHATTAFFGVALQFALQGHFQRCALSERHSGAQRSNTLLLTWDYQEYDSVLKRIMWWVRANKSHIKKVTCLREIKNNFTFYLLVQLHSKPCDKRQCCRNGSWWSFYGVLPSFCP